MKAVQPTKSANERRATPKIVAQGAILDTLNGPAEKNAEASVSKASR